jgi:hypothetical protein
MKLRWGPHLRPSDVTWSVTPGSPPFSPTPIASRMAERYDPEYEAVQRAFQRWATAAQRLSKFRVVQLAATCSTDRVAATARGLVAPAFRDENGVETGSGFLSVPGLAPMELSILPLANCNGTQTMASTAALNGLSSQAVLPPLGVQLLSLPPLFSSQSLFDTIWPTVDPQQREVLLLLFDTRTQPSRHLWHWMSACVEQFQRVSYTSGCVLPSGANAWTGKPLGFVRSPNSRLRLFGNRLPESAGTYTFPVISGVNLKWNTVHGVVLFPDTWRDLRSCVAAVARCADAVASLADSMSASRTHAAVLSAMQCCFSEQPLSRQGLAAPATLPFP